MIDTAAPVTYWWVDLLKASIPYIGQILLVIVTAVMATLATQHATAPYKLDAADRPRPTPIVSLSDVDRVFEIHCGEVKGTLADLKRLLEPAAKRPALPVR